MGKEEQEPIFEELLEQLKDQNANVRRAAARALSEHEDAWKAARYLKEAIMREKSPLTKNSLNYLFKKILDKNTGKEIEETPFEILIEQLKEDIVEIQLSAFNELINSKNPKAIDVLISLLKEDFLDYHAIVALGERGDPQAVLPLLERLDYQTRCIEETVVSKYEKSEELIRKSILQALGKLGDSRAVKSLISIIKDSNSFGRKEAIESLGAIGDKRAIEPIYSLLEEELNVEMVIIVASALRKLGDYRAFEALLDLVENRTDELSMNLAWGIKELGEYGNRKATEVIVKHWNNPKLMLESIKREAAVEALAKLQDERSIDTLIEALSDSSYTTRVFAYEALYKFQDKKVVAPILQCLIHDLLIISSQGAKIFTKMKELDKEKTDEFISSLTRQLMKREKFARYQVFHVLCILSREQVINPINRELKQAYTLEKDVYYRGKMRRLLRYGEDDYAM
ncbi:MAG: HEAT repeat domain-containing protein [Candidatus Heimdallarchaeota archaeon]|nr:HEAT repeat domain-containing protein [Candidatus Heimdallarchaeota archaeon]